MTPAGHGVFVFAEWERGLGNVLLHCNDDHWGDGCAHSDLNTA